MSLNGRLRKLEAAAGTAERAVAVLDEHGQGRDDPVLVQIPRGAGRMSEAAYRRRWPRGLLVFCLCFCGECPSGRDDDKGER